MLARLDRDVLSKKPDWLTGSCGVNDVWHNPGVWDSLRGPYQKDVRTILSPEKQKELQGKFNQDVDAMLKR